MPSVTLSLHHFNQSVTSCELIIDRASLCDLINTGNPEAIVVVDERYCPLGLIESQTLIAYLLYQQQHPETRNPSSSCLDLSGWLRPIIPLNARMAVSEFLGTLTGEALALVPILVDAQGKLLGRLDTGKLLQFCLGRSILDDPPPQPRISDRIPPPAAIVLWNFWNNYRCRCCSTVQKREFYTKIRLGVNKSGQLSPLISINLPLLWLMTP